MPHFFQSSDASHSPCNCPRNIRFNNSRICSSASSSSQDARKQVISPHSRIHRRLLHALLPPLIAALFTLITCHFITHPPSFLLTEEQRFVRFTEEVFRSELSGNTLTLHYMVSDPSSYGLNGTDTILGSASLKARQDACAALENDLTALRRFDYDKLSEQRQLTYDVFLDYLRTELGASDLLLYDEPLGPTLGVQAQLPILLAEYAFRTKGDIEDYLSLLSQIPDYFDSLLSFEQDKASAGLFMSSGSVLGVISQCLDFVSDMEDHYLMEIFNEKVDSINNLTADEKIAYKKRNQSILTEYVLPAYQSLAEGLADLEGTCINEMGLYYYPDGRKYYEYLVKSMVGDERAIDEIEEEIKTRMVADYAALQELLPGSPNEASDTTAQTETTGDTTQQETASEAAAQDGNGFDPAAESETSAAEEPIAMLADLNEKISNDFPPLTAVSCEVKYVHESLQEYLSPAFYLTPTIDDYTSNVIYINPASEYSGLELYTTLAHEGYPGHLYQNVFFASQSPDLLRCILDVGGYTEGWATYVEMYAYSLYDGDRTTAEISRLNRSFTLGLASLLDIGIHYRGYTPEEVSNFLTQLGFSADTAESLYQTILEAPANYLQYYVGCLNFESLRDSLKSDSTNFSLKAFHQAVLETGPVPFAILREQCIKKLS